jgi:hypothetical protein
MIRKDLLRDTIQHDRALEAKHTYTSTHRVVRRPGMRNSTHIRPVTSSAPIHTRGTRCVQGTAPAIPEQATGPKASMLAPSLCLVHKLTNVPGRPTVPIPSTTHRTPRKGLPLLPHPHKTIHPYLPKPTHISTVPRDQLCDC